MANCSQAVAAILSMRASSSALSGSQVSERGTDSRPTALRNSKVRASGPSVRGSWLTGGISHGQRLHFAQVRSQLRTMRRRPAVQVVMPAQRHEVRRVGWRALAHAGLVLDVIEGQTAARTSAPRRAMRFSPNRSAAVVSGAERWRHARGSGRAAPRQATGEGSQRRASSQPSLDQRQRPAVVDHPRRDPHARASRSAPLRCTSRRRPRSLHPGCGGRR